MRARHKALLLIGPTGSGKTPLGEYLEAKGFCGQTCCHFDFGENLRRASRGELTGLTSEALRVIADVLERGALLEDETFFVAREVLQGFLARPHPKTANLLVMNGLPRHVGQATQLEKSVEVQGVICLECSPGTVLERLAKNAGGDRSARIDDEHALVAKKLADFALRTAPLVAHYEALGARIYRIAVGPASQASDMAHALREASETSS